MTQNEHRQAGSEIAIIAPDKSEWEIVQREITTAMVFAGLRTLGQWEERKEAGESVTKGDLVSAIYAAMRRLA